MRPHRRSVAVTALALLATSAAAAQPGLTAAARADVVARVLERTDGRYVFPDVARRMRVAVEAALRAGRYDALDDPAQFADALTADLRAVSHDRHLRVAYGGA